MAELYIRKKNDLSYESKIEHEDPEKLREFASQVRKMGYITELYLEERKRITPGNNSFSYDADYRPLTHNNNRIKLLLEAEIPEKKQSPCQNKKHTDNDLLEVFWQKAEELGYTRNSTLSDLDIKRILKGGKDE